MFNSRSLLARKEPLGEIRMAASVHAKMYRRNLSPQMDLISKSEEISHPRAPMPLRLSSMLMASGGDREVVLIVYREAPTRYPSPPCAYDLHRLLDQFNDAWNKVKPNSDSTVLPEQRAQAKKEANTLPEVENEETDVGGVIDIEQTLDFSHHASLFDQQTGYLLMLEEDEEEPDDEDDEVIEEAHNGNGIVVEEEEEDVDENEDEEEEEDEDDEEEGVNRVLVTRVPQFHPTRELGETRLDQFQGAAALHERVKEILGEHNQTTNILPVPEINEYHVVYWEFQEDYRRLLCPLITMPWEDVARHIQGITAHDIGLLEIYHFDDHTRWVPVYRLTATDGLMRIDIREIRPTIFVESTQVIENEIIDLLARSAVDRHLPMPEGYRIAYRTVLTDGTSRELSLSLELDIFVHLLHNIMVYDNGANYEFEELEDDDVDLIVWGDDNEEEEEGIDDGGHGVDEEEDGGGGGDEEEDDG